MRTPRLKFIRPIWGQDYAPGFSLYTRQQGNIISDGIVWFQDQDAPLWFAKLLRDGFSAGLSHVVSIVNETEGMEATVGGIRKCALSDYFNNSTYLCVCREPDGIDMKTHIQKWIYQKTLLGNPYDYGVFPWFAVMTLTGMQSFIPALRKMTPIGHAEGARVCSTFEADGFSKTDKYKDIKLFQEWNVLGLHVHRLFLDFTYKPFRYDKER